MVTHDTSKRGGGVGKPPDEPAPAASENLTDSFGSVWCVTLMVRVQCLCVLHFVCVCVSVRVADV